MNVQKLFPGDVVKLKPNALVSQRKQFGGRFAVVKSVTTATYTSPGPRKLYTLKGNPGAAYSFELQLIQRGKKHLFLIGQ